MRVYKTLQKAGEFVLTLPGSYHAGFSTGLNIGEAVNFASRSWLPYGLKAQNIYRRTREKIPVFPFEWIVIQNIIHLDSLNLDEETKRELKSTYEKWYAIEKTNRTVIEKELALKSVTSGLDEHQSPMMMEGRESVPEDAH